MSLMMLSLLACAASSARPPEAEAAAAAEPELPEVVAPPPAPASDDAMRVFLMSGSHHSTAVELVCPSGFRHREGLEGGWVSFEGVPAGEDCTLYFKGGAPAKYEPVQGGQDLKCQIAATTGVCAVQGG